MQRDVTARKRAEREAHAREAQRIESLGALASGIAHDFNNIIGAILGNVAIAVHDLEAGESPASNLAQIRAAGLRARGLIQQILAYGRRRPEAFTRESLGDIIDDAIALLRSTLPAGIEVRAAVCAEPLDVLADANQLHQVLLNLGTNAWHAIGPRDRGGRIDVNCEAVAPRADGTIGGFDHFAPSASGRYALIRFSDNGCGMDAATAERIFEPYFTTKPIGQGTGLGLSATAGILAAHHADVRVVTAPDRGTTIEILFPLMVPTTERAAAAAPPSARPSGGGGERVLVVDDDEVVRVMLEALLVRAGYRVTAFSDSPAALAAVLGRSSDFHVVVTDHNMPGMSGLQLAGEVAAKVPDLPVVIASGYLDDALRAAAAKVGAAAVIGKEFSVEGLADLLRNVVRPRVA